MLLECFVHLAFLIEPFLSKFLDFNSVKVIKDLFPCEMMAVTWSTSVEGKSKMKSLCVWEKTVSLSSLRTKSAGFF